LEIEAELLKPADWDGKTKLPLVAYVHGGPTGAWIDSVDACRNCWLREGSPCLCRTFADRWGTVTNLSR